MNLILSNEQLNEVTCRMWVHAPDIALRAKAGQFVILRVHDRGERIPLTIAGCDPERGAIMLVYQIAGKTTRMMSWKLPGDYLEDVTGPLGRPTHIPEGTRRMVVVAGGLGTAIALPQLRQYCQESIRVEVILGFRTQGMTIFEKEIRELADRLTIMTDDGSYGQRGRVTDCLAYRLVEGAGFDHAFAVGPLPMMKAVCDVTRQWGLPTQVSMNPVMIDGTGMCGGCRLTVGGVLQFACVDGPEFDGHQVDFDEAMLRQGMFRESEHEADHACRRMEV